MTLEIQETGGPFQGALTHRIHGEPSQVLVTDPATCLHARTFLVPDSSRSKRFQLFYQGGALL